MILNHLHFFHHDDDKNYWHNSFLFCAIYNNLQSWLFLQMMLQFPEWIPNRLITLDKFPVYGKLSNVFNLLGNSTRFNTSLLSLELILYKCCFHAREIRERRKGEKAEETWLRCSTVLRVEQVADMTRNHFIGNMFEVLAIQRRPNQILCNSCERKAPVVSRCMNARRKIKWGRLVPPPAKVC